MQKIRNLIAASVETKRSPEDRALLKERQETLIGKQITGGLFYSTVDGDDNKRRYWVRWNDNRKDNVFVPQKIVDAVVGPKPPVGFKITVTIAGMGPKQAAAAMQHPNSFKIDAVPEPRPVVAKHTNKSSTRSSCNSTVSSDSMNWRNLRSPRTGKRPVFVNSRSATKKSWRVVA